MTGMSPSEYELNFGRFVRSQVGLSEDGRNVRRETSKRLGSFKVLKGGQEKVRLNVNKMREKFEDPYVVKKVMSTGSELCIRTIE